MKIILVDAVYAFVIKDEGIFQEMFDILEKYPNRKIQLWQIVLSKKGVPGGYKSVR